jgi:hypothetical protein
LAAPTLALFIAAWFSCLSYLCRLTKLAFFILISAAMSSYEFPLLSLQSSSTSVNRTDFLSYFGDAPEPKLLTITFGLRFSS